MPFTHLCYALRCPTRFTRGSTIALRLRILRFVAGAVYLVPTHTFVWFTFLWFVAVIYRCHRVTSLFTLPFGFTRSRVTVTFVHRTRCVGLQFRFPVALPFTHTPPYDFGYVVTVTLHTVVTLRFGSHTRTLHAIYCPVGFTRCYTTPHITFCSLPLLFTLR